MVLLLSTTPLPIVLAETDPNTYVSDFMKSGKDAEDQPVKKEQNEPAEDRSTDGTAGGSSFGDYVKMIFAFIFVVGLLFALLKFLNRKNRMFDQHRLMKNAGGLSLGQQKSIQLVIIGDSYYLVGVGNEVRLLKEITDPDEIQKLESYFGESDLQTSPGIVQNLISKYTNRNQASSKSDDQQVEFGNLFSSKLNELKEERRQHLRRLEEKENRKEDE